MNLLKALRSTWSWITMEKIVVYTSSNNISCIGEKSDAAAHPIVYYYLNENSPEEYCGYCNVTFILDKNADHKTHYP